MKKIFICILCFHTWCAVAQNANWGTGLAVTVTVNSSSVELSVYDPIISQTRTTSFSTGNNPVYVNTDGVVVATGDNQYMYYATYDIEQHQWKYDSHTIGSSDRIVNTADGVVVGTGSSQYFYYATYDIELHQWKYDSHTIGSSDRIVATADGVAIGTGSSQYLYYATYDVELHQWKYDSHTLGSTDRVIATADGVAIGTGSSQYLYYATYDVELHQWKYDSHTLGSTDRVIATSDGVAAGYGSSQYVYYAIYDFNLHSWKYDSRTVGSAGGFTLSGGTVSYTGSSTGTAGYNPVSQSWGSSPTTPACKLLPYFTNSSQWVFMRCMSMGASAFTYSCGDGHQIYRKQGWKKYNINNSYNVDLTVTNGVSNTSCNSIVNITIGVEENTASHFSVFPNPSPGNFQIQYPASKSTSIAVADCIGQIIFQTAIGNSDHLSLDLPGEGIYFLMINSVGEVYSQKIIVSR